MSEIPKQLIVYDGVCILCNRYIQYLLRIDRKAQFIFSTYQGLPAYIEKDTQQLPFQESVSYLRDGIWWQQSSAALMIYKDVYGRFHWSQLAWIFPRVLRDSVYRSISKNRYRLFGKYDSCLLPNATFQDRFIG
jgi:predicted DCC family thiol-disulfide oxidoreductase YuxK